MEPGRILAAEYPRSVGEEASIAKLWRILDVGVTLFVDLTHPADFLEPYEPLLDQLRVEYTDRAIRRVGIPVRDMAVPRPPAAALRALDEIDTELASGGGGRDEC